MSAKLIMMWMNDEQVRRAYAKQRDRIEKLEKENEALKSRWMDDKDKIIGLNSKIEKLEKENAGAKTIITQLLKYRVKIFYSDDKYDYTYYENKYNRLREQAESFVKSEENEK